MIKLDDYVTASGRYPERWDSEEWDLETTLNAVELLERVNALLLHLKISKADVTSGFRPSEVNSKTKGASKKSAHLTGEAVDLLDDQNQTLAKQITKDLLEKFDLYREDFDYTRGKYTNWVHLQTRKTRSGKRIFKP